MIQKKVSNEIVEKAWKRVEAGEKLKDVAEDLNVKYGTLYARFRTIKKRKQKEDTSKVPVVPAVPEKEDDEEENKPAKKVVQSTVKPASRSKEEGGTNERESVEVRDKETSEVTTDKGKRDRTGVAPKWRKPVFIGLGLVGLGLIGLYLYKRFKKPREEQEDKPASYNPTKIDLEKERGKYSVI